MELLIGFSLSLMIGLTGIGAGILTTPLLILILNLEPIVAVGTALAFATVIKAYTGILYALKGFCDKKILIFLTIGGIPGVVVGSYFVSISPFNNDYIMIFIGCLIVSTSIINIFSLSEKRRSIMKFDYPLILLAVSFLVGLEVGFSSIGTGIIIELLLLSFTNLPLPVVIGTSLLYGSVISLVGSFAHAFLGNVNHSPFWGLLTGGIMGAFVASRIISLMPQKPLRYTILTFIFVLGISLIYRGIT